MPVVIVGGMFTFFVIVLFCLAMVPVGGGAAATAYGEHRSRKECEQALANERRMREEIRNLHASNFHFQSLEEIDYERYGIESIEVIDDFYAISDKAFTNDPEEREDIKWLALGSMFEVVERYGGNGISDLTITTETMHRGDPGRTDNIWCFYYVMWAKGLCVRMRKDREGARNGLDRRDVAPSGTENGGEDPDWIPVYR